MKLKSFLKWLPALFLIVGTLSVNAQPVVKLRNIEAAPGSGYTLYSDAQGKWYAVTSANGAVNVNLTPIAYYPATTGNPANNNEIVIDPDGAVWVIDEGGEAIMLKEATSGGETILTAGVNVTITGTGTSGDPYIINSPLGGGDVTTAQLGDSTALLRQLDTTTVLIQDSILVYSVANVEVGRDTISGASLESTTHPYLRQFRELEISDEIDVVFLGDSRTSSYHTPLELLSRLSELDNYSFGGFGYMSFDNAPSSVFESVTNTGTLEDFSNEGLEGTSGHALILATGQEYEATTVSEYGVFDEIVVWYYQQPSGGSFTIDIDGVSQAIDTDGSASVQQVVLNVTEGNHVINFSHDAGGEVALLEYCLNKTTGNYQLHIIGNAGASSNAFTGLTNTHFYDYINPNLLIIRLGVNGGEVNNPATVATNLTTITDRVKTSNTDLNTIWSGEPDEGGSSYTLQQIKDFNTYISNTAETEKVGFVNIFNIIPNWTDFHNQGFGDSGVHENEQGGNIIGDYYFDYILNAKYNTSLEQKVQSGTSNKVAYYTDTDEVNSSNISTDGDKMSVGGTVTTDSPLLSAQGNNTNVFSAGYGASGANPWWSVNSKSGYPVLSWFSKYSSGWKSTYHNATPFLIGVDANEMYFEAAENTPTGDEISFSKRIQITKDYVAIPSSAGYTALQVAANATGDYPLFSFATNLTGYGELNFFSKRFPVGRRSTVSNVKPISFSGRNGGEFVIEIGSAVERDSFPVFSNALSLDEDRLNVFTRAEFNGTVSGSDPVNDDDFVTKYYFEQNIPDVFWTSDGGELSTTHSIVNIDNLGVDDIELNDHGDIQLKEASINGSSYVQLQAPESITISSVKTLPVAGNGYWYEDGLGNISQKYTGMIEVATSTSNVYNNVSAIVVDLGSTQDSQGFTYSSTTKKITYNQTDSAKYRVDYSATISSSISNEVQLAVYENDVIVSRSARQVDNGSSKQNIAGFCTFTANQNDTIDVRVISNDQAGVADVTVHNISVIITKVD